MGAGGAGRAASVAARRSGSKVGKDAGRRAAAEARLKRMKRSKMKREFKRGAKEFGKDVLEGAMQSQGLNVDKIRNNKRSGTGRLLGYLGGEGFDFNDPPMDSPQKVSPVSNPTISSLEKQLKDIAKVASDLGVVTKKQQDELLKDARKIEAASLESALEQPTATSIASPGVGDAIGPADSVIEKLIAAIASLQEEIDDKVREAQQDSFGNSFVEGFLDSMGLGGVKKARAAKRATPQLRKGFKQTSGGAFLDTKTGKYVKPEQALKNFKTVDPSHLSKAAKARQATAVLGKSSGKLTSVLGGAAAKTKAGFGMAATAVLGKSSGKVASALGSAVAKSKAGAGSATKLSKDAIAKVAKPLVTRSLVKTGIKSIPIVGAVAGGLFALGRLIKGDAVGAGLDATSGLAGPLTAIPALVLSLARDVYMSAFGVAPETDPLVGERMTMVKDVVTELAEAELGKKVTKPGGGKPATAQQKTAAVPGAPGAPGASAAAAPAATQVSAPPAASTAPTASGGGGGGGSSAASSGGGGGATPTPSGGGGGSATATPEASGGTPQQVAAEQTSKKLEGEEAAPPAASGSAPEVKSLSGEKILQASTEQPPSPSSMGMTGSSPPKPSTLPTTKGRAKGMGDVPEPSYLNMGSIAKQLYFGSVAGVMAS